MGKQETTTGAPDDFDVLVGFSDLLLTSLLQATASSETLEESDGTKQLKLAEKWTIFLLSILLFKTIVLD